jgi:hypothetical protein
MNPYDQPPGLPRWLRILRLSTELTLLASTSTLAAIDTYDRFRLQSRRPFGHPPVLPHIPNPPHPGEENL